MEPDFLARYPYVEQHITHASYDFIYVSPHLDDVPLSCSGATCCQRAQGRNILVVTVFAGEPDPPFSPFVQSVHRSWQAPEERPYQIRKAEERKAMALLGIDYAWLGWHEILYRDPEISEVHDFFLEPESPAVSPRDTELFTTLCGWFVDASHVYPGAHFVAPLGLGMHCDHQLVFQAALKSLAPDRLLFFEDFPYASYYSKEELIEYVKPFNMSKVEEDISAYLDQRIAVSETYQSQIPTFFFMTPSFRELIRTYTLETGNQQHPIERYWKLAQ